MCGEERIDVDFWKDQGPGPRRKSKSKIKRVGKLGPFCTLYAVGR